MSDAESEKAVFWKTVVELRNKLESKSDEVNRLEKQVENTKKHVSHFIPLPTLKYLLPSYFFSL